MKVHVTRKTVVAALIAGLALFALAQAKWCELAASHGHAQALYQMGTANFT